MIARVLVIVMLLGGCAHQSVSDDTDYVHALRIKITHVRHAIRETRRTIARNRGAPHLPELYVRVAELLSEEGSYHYRLAFEREGRASRVLHVPQVRLLKTEAVQTYNRVLRDYPDTPLKDRILFNIGHEWRELGDYAKMRENLEKLVENHGESPLRHEALLVLGDYHFNRGQFEAARSWYDKIVLGPPNSVSPMGWYKLAWVDMNLGECTPALASFERAILHARAMEPIRLLPGEKPKKSAAPTAAQKAAGNRPAAAQSLDVRREALVDLTYCFVRERRVTGALEFFRNNSPSRQVYVAALSRLLRRYGVLNEPEGTVQVARELLRIGPPDQDRLDDARELYTTLKAQKRWDRVGHDAADMLKVMTQNMRASDMEEEARRLVVTEFERYARDLLTLAHEAAKKDPKQGFHEVVYGYTAYLDQFPNSPHRWDLHENLADVLFRTQQYFRSGLHFTELARILEKGQHKTNALYDGVVSFQRSLEAKVPQTTVDRVVARAGLRRAALELLTYKLPVKKVRRVKFAVALTYYDEGRFSEAVDRFTALAHEFPQTEQADAAVHLVLDSYNAINDVRGVLEAGKRFLSTSSPASAKVREEIRPIVAAAEQALLDKISLQAAGDEGRSYEALEDFATKNKGTSLGERALVNAFVAARAQGDMDKLYELADRLTREYPKSENLPGMLTAIAQLAVASFDLDRGITFLRRAADANPTQRARLLLSAGQLLENFGDASGARAAYEAAMKSPDASNLGSRISTRFADLVERTSSPATVISALRGLGSKDPEVLARIGLAQVRLGQGDDAEQTFDGVLGGATPASVGAKARARYGAAETMLGAVQSYPAPADIDSFQEFVTIMEVAEQSYVTAAQTGHPMMTAASLGRLSYMSDYLAKRLSSMRPPPGLSAAEATAVKAAIAGRVKNLQALVTQAMTACKRQAWRGKIFNSAVLACLKGQAPAKDPIAFRAIKRRSAVKVNGLEKAREKLARNPEDLDALRELGQAFLNGGDAHTARIVLQRIAATGGGPKDANNLGLAAYAIGDFSAALTAFARAAEGGLEAGRQNVAHVLRELGLGQAAAEALTKWKPGRIGGKRLGGGGS